MCFERKARNSVVTGNYLHFISYSMIWYLLREVFGSNCVPSNTDMKCGWSLWAGVVTKHEVVKQESE